MKPKNLKPKTYQLTIGWLYPELMSTYGDRGNIIALTKRCEWRGIEAKIERISLDTKYEILNTCGLLFMGGAQDAQQEIVSRDLQGKKGLTFIRMLGNGTPGLFICAAYQFLGKYYKTADGNILPGLSIFPCFTENPGEKSERLIGNIIIKPNIHDSKFMIHDSSIVGFENHGGRTFLEDKSMAFGNVIKGFGNNGEDKTEGIIYKNSIGTYLHGPLLPKNPDIADWLIEKALEVKYGEELKLKPLDDSLEQQAKEAILKKLT